MDLRAIHRRCVAANIEDRFTVSVALSQKSIMANLAGKNCQLRSLHVSRIPLRVCARWRYFVSGPYDNRNRYPNLGQIRGSEAAPERWRDCEHALDSRIAKRIVGMTQRIFHHRIALSHLSKYFRGIWKFGLRFAGEVPLRRSAERIKLVRVKPAACNRDDCITAQ